MNILVGKTLTGISLAKDDTAILFHTDSGDIKVLCDADCCSHTWVEHVELPAKGFPTKVIDADDIDMPDLGDMPDCDCVEYYGFKATTENGDLIIDYRNDSNGYYGGNLSWPDDYFYGGVYSQNVSKEEWVKLTEDK